MNALRPEAAAAAALLVFALAATRAAPAPGRAAAVRAADDPAPVKAFEERVHSYVALRQSAEKSLPPLAPAETDAAVIRAHRDALADAVRRARAGAHPGDVFVPAVRPILRAVVEEELRRDPSQLRTIQQGNPAREGNAPPVDFVVNAAYPEGAPLSTVPPSLLARLPRLPDDLQYRFAGRHLLLVDTRARIVVDFLGEAAPR